MSFHYPPPAAGGSEMDMSHAPYLTGYPVPSQQQPHPGMTDPRTSQLSMHDTREPSLGLRRSFSTPNAVPYPDAGMDQAQGGMPGEKKRNKLGYHRSSVACGNCRKRKIRCVPDGNDKQGRCTNCMRLKKECSFHPVDQPSPIEARGKASARGPGSQRNPSASASPATSIGQLSETPSKRPLSRQIIPPGIGQIGVSSQDDDARTSISDTPSGGRVAGQGFELSSHPSLAWGSTEVSLPIQGKPGEVPGQWQPGGVMGDQFSPYGGIPTSPAWQADVHAHAPNEGFPWSNMTAPARSMSYSGEGMPGHQHGHFPAAPPGVMYDRRASNFTGVYNPAMGGPVPNVEHGTHNMMDSRGAFPGGGAPTDPLVWEGSQGQQSVHDYQKQDGFDSWAYSSNANGHQ